MNIIEESLLFPNKSIPFPEGLLLLTALHSVGLLG